MVSGTRRPSPTSDEKRVRACSTAGPIIASERSSDRSIPSANGILPNRGVAAFDETLVRVSTETGNLPNSGKESERETRDGISVLWWVVSFAIRRVLTTFNTSRIEVVWEDRVVPFLEGLAGKEVAGARARIEETGVDFSSEGAASDIGECLRAFTSFFTSTLVFLIGGSPDVRVSTRLGAGAETTRLAGFAPIRELPLGGSLSRTVLLGCSRALARSLERGEGPEMASVDAVSKLDLRGLRPSVMSLRAGRSSRETLGGLVLSLRGAEGGSGFVELGLALERAD